MRTADDGNLEVRRARAGERVRNSEKQFIEKKLKLKVNERQSAVARATAGQFLGSGFLKRKGRVRRRGATRRLERLKEKIRVLTRRTCGEPWPALLERVTRLVNGGTGY